MDDTVTIDTLSIALDWLMDYPHDPEPVARWLADIYIDHAIVVSDLMNDVWGKRYNLPNRARSRRFNALGRYRSFIKESASSMPAILQAPAAQHVLLLSQVLQDLPKIEPTTQMVTIWVNKVVADFWMPTDQEKKKTTIAGLLVDLLTLPTRDKLVGLADALAERFPEAAAVIHTHLDGAQMPVDPAILERWYEGYPHTSACTHPLQGPTFTILLDDHLWFDVRFSPNPLILCPTYHQRRQRRSIPTLPEQIVHLAGSDGTMAKLAFQLGWMFGMYPNHQPS